MAKEFAPAANTFAALYEEYCSYVRTLEDEDEIELARTAVLEKAVKLGEMLKSADLSVKEKRYKKWLHVAITYEDDFVERATSLMKEKNQFERRKIKLSLDHLLFPAADGNNLAAVQSLLKAGANPNFYFEKNDYNTPMHVAALNANGLDVVEQLLLSGAHFVFKNLDEQSAIDAAACDATTEGHCHNLLFMFVALEKPEQRQEAYDGAMKKIAELPESQRAERRQFLDKAFADAQEFYEMKSIEKVAESRCALERLRHHEKTEILPRKNARFLVSVEKVAPEDRNPALAEFWSRLNSMLEKRNKPFVEEKEAKGHISSPQEFAASLVEQYAKQCIEDSNRRKRKAEAASGEGLMSDVAEAARAARAVEAAGRAAAAAAIASPTVLTSPHKSPNKRYKPENKNPENKNPEPANEDEEVLPDPKKQLSWTEAVLEKGASAAVSAVHAH